MSLQPSLTAQGTSARWPLTGKRSRRSIRLWQERRTTKGTSKGTGRGKKEDDCTEHQQQEKVSLSIWEKADAALMPGLPGKGQGPRTKDQEMRGSNFLSFHAPDSTCQFNQQPGCNFPSHFNAAFCLLLRHVIAPRTVDYNKFYKFNTQLERQCRIIALSFNAVKRTRCVVIFGE